MPIKEIRRPGQHSIHPSAEASDPGATSDLLNDLEKLWIIHQELHTERYTAVRHLELCAYALVGCVLKVRFIDPIQNESQKVRFDQAWQVNPMLVSKREAKRVKVSFRSQVLRSETGYLNHL